MELKDLDNKQLAELTTKLDDKEALREIATYVGVTFSGNTGVNTLKEKILSEIILEEESEENDEPEDQTVPNDPVAKALAAQNKALEEEKEADVHVAQAKKVYSVAEMMEMDAAQVKDSKLRREVVRTQAMRLRRVQIHNLDPADSAVPGAIITVYSKYTGKVSKFIPFGEENENGWHIPQILYDELKTRTYNMRKEIKNRNNSVGIKEYKTIKTPKFNIIDLPDLTAQELKNLANSQQGRGAIDRSN